MTNGERYITQELKDIETQILGAEDKISAIEEKLYEGLIFSTLDYIDLIQINAQLIAKLDVLLCFPRVSLENCYVKPQILDNHIIKIKTEDIR